MRESEERIGRELADWRAPGEEGSEARARRVAMGAFAERPSGRRRRVGLRAALAGAVAVAATALALSPAGAKVGDLIGDAVGGATPEPVPSQTVPGADPLLVEGGGQLWLLQRSGRRSSVGDLADGAWSPRGRFIVAADGPELVAVDREGTERWAIAPPSEPRDPAWSESGFRIAYLAGEELRVVAGDGTGDRALAAGAEPVGPEWRPPAAGALAGSLDGVGTHQVAYAGGGAVRLIDADSGREVWSTRVGGGAVRELSWAQGGDRLLVRTRREIAVLDRDGRLHVGTRAGPRSPVAISPRGKLIALAERDRGIATVSLVSSSPGGHPGRQVFKGPGGIVDLEWSADGDWLAVGWRGGDQWVFLRMGGRSSGARAVAAVGRIGAGDGFPRIADWCCAAEG